MTTTEAVVFIEGRLGEDNEARIRAIPGVTGTDADGIPEPRYYNGFQGGIDEVHGRRSRFVGGTRKLFAEIRQAVFPTEA